MNTELEELYQQVLLDHSKRPRNFGEIAEGAIVVHGDNPSCGDEIHLHVKISPEGGVEDVKFTGQGCAISMASASMMTLKVKGRARPEVLETMRQFHDLVTGASESDARQLGDLRLMQGVRKFPQRVKCAMLAWRALEQALDEGRDAEAQVSTEN